MTDATQGPKLVQVLYDPRFGMQAFFDNGDIATLVGDAWLWAGNIVIDADYHAQAPDGKGTYNNATIQWKERAQRHLGQQPVISVQEVSR